MTRGRAPRRTAPRSAASANGGRRRTGRPGTSRSARPRRGSLTTSSPLPPGSIQSSPMICAVVRTSTTEEAVAAMAEARRAGADLCELRIDYLRDPDLKAILSAKPLPVLATVRPKWEGGQYEGDEALRFGLLEDACRYGADYVDVEFRAFKDFRRGDARLIVSYHDFEKTPDD